MFVDFHEVAERHRKKSVLGGHKRVHAQRIFEARDEDGKAQRVEAAIREHEILFERRENLAVLPRYLFHLLDYS
jgi:hypothetical protein